MKSVKIDSPNLDLRKCKTIPCECGGIVWLNGAVIKEVSGIMLGSGDRKGITQIGILFCAECRRIHPDHVAQIQEKTDEPKN